MLGEILTSSRRKSKVAGMSPAMILPVFVKMLELSADETPANMVEKVKQRIKKINMSKEL
jgi:mannose/fructose-specific phosphotransferase system component IIA